MALYDREGILDLSSSKEKNLKTQLDNFIFTKLTSTREQLFVEDESTLNVLCLNRCHGRATTKSAAKINKVVYTTGKTEMAVEKVLEKIDNLSCFPGTLQRTGTIHPFDLINFS